MPARRLVRPNTRVPGSAPPESQRGKLVTHRFIGQQTRKGDYSRPLLPVAGNDEIVVLLTQRQEAEAGGAGDRLDRHPPIGTALRDGSSHGVVGPGFDAVAGGTPPHP